MRNKAFRPGRETRQICGGEVTWSVTCRIAPTTRLEAPEIDRPKTWEVEDGIEKRGFMRFPEFFKGVATRPRRFLATTQPFLSSSGQAVPKMRNSKQNSQNL